MMAEEVAALQEVTARTVYLWQKGMGLPKGLRPMPKADVEKRRRQGG